MFKQIKKLLIVFVLLFGIFLVACDKDCPECQECPGKDELCSGLIKPEDCPADKDCPECPDCSGKIDPSECPACPEPGDGVKVPTEIELVPESVAVGETKELVVLVTPDDAYAGYKFVSSDPSIVTVDEEGKVTGVRPGTATITVTSLLDGKVTSEAEVSVTEADSTMQDIDIVQRELKYLTDKLSSGYVSEDFSLPQPWNGDVKVVYTDADGAEIEDFKMPDLGEETSRLYNLSLTVSYREATLDGSVQLKLVKAAEGKNDFEKVNFAVEVAEALLAEYMDGTSKVTSDIYLPNSVYGIKLNWSSNKTYVLTSAGALTKPTNDEQVTFSITPKLGAASASKSYTITVAGYGKNDKLEYVKEQGVLKDIIGGTFFGNIALPSVDDKFGIKLTYVSSDEEILTSDGKIEVNGKEVTLTVTAVYEDPNYPADAFVEVFDIKVNTGEISENNAYAAFNTAVLLKTAAGQDFEQLKHLPYGGGATGAQTFAITKAQMNALKDALNAVNSKLSFEFDEEDFKANVGSDGKVESIELVSQYLRYHESKIKIIYQIFDKDPDTNEDAKVAHEVSYTWVLNTGIAEKRNTVYVGGRSNDQASANPAEIGDMLQTFSHWDKYVGVISSDSARAGTLYSDGFSGYTFYVDVPTGLNEVKFTKDAEGNVTVEAKGTAEAVRYQAFIKKHLLLEINSVETVFVPNSNKQLELNESKKDAKVYAYIPRINVNYTKGWTYAGTWAEYYVNNTEYKLHIPVSSLSMGGSFTDGVAMATYSKSTISVATKANSDAADILNDYGSSYQINRNDTIGFDGYYPAAVIAPKNGETEIKYGQPNVYKFTVGIEDGMKNPDETIGRPQAIQYCIPSTLSTLWGTPYVLLEPAGLAYTTVHAQEKANLYATGQGWLLGENKSLDVTVEKYFLHALNEVDSSYIVNEIKSYAQKLAGDADLKTLKAEDIVFEDISIEDLNKLVKFKTELAKLANNWLDKEDVALAIKLNGLLVEAAKAEVTKQKARTDLTAASLEALKSAIATAASKETASDVLDEVTKASTLALYEAAKRNYDALTPGQKGLYDKGYSCDIEGLTIEVKKTDGIFEAFELLNEILNAKSAVSAGDSENVASLVKRYQALKEKELSSGTAQDLIGDVASAKLYGMQFAILLLEGKEDSAKLEALYAEYTGANTHKFEGEGSAVAFDKATVAESFKNETYDQDNTPNKPEDDKTSVEAFYLKNLANNQVSYKKESVDVAKAISDAFAKLPTLSASGLTEDLTADQKAALVAIVGDPDKDADDYDEENKRPASLLEQLLALYKKIDTTKATAADVTFGISDLYNSAKRTALAGVFNNVNLFGASGTAKEGVGNFYVSDASKDKKPVDNAFKVLDAYNNRVGTAVALMVQALPGETVLALTDQELVEAAQDAYDALSAKQQELADAYDSTVTPKKYCADKLEALEAKFKQLLKSADVTPVEVQLNALPIKSQITIENEAEVIAARKAYDALMDKYNVKDKTFTESVTDNPISKAGYEKLVAAEAGLKDAKEADAKVADGAYDKAQKAFKDAKTEGAKKAGEVKITAKNVEDAKKLIEAYEAMNDYQKTLFNSLSNGDYVKLYKELKSAVATYDKYVK